MLSTFILILLKEELCLPPFLFICSVILLILVWVHGSIFLFSGLSSSTITVYFVAPALAIRNFFWLAFVSDFSLHAQCQIGVLSPSPLEIMREDMENGDKEKIVTVLGRKCSYFF